MFSNNKKNHSINFASFDDLLYLRLIFAAVSSLALVFGLGFGLEKFRWQVQAQENRRAADADTTVYPHLDPSVREQLEKALAPENRGLQAVNNPFIDRASLSSQKPAVASVASAGSPINPIGGGGAPIAPGQFALNGSGSIAPPNTPDAISELNKRLRERDRSARLGAATLPLLPSLYDVGDVEPIGVIGKSFASKVLFRSKATGKVFSAPLGARFNDGMLRDAESTGVIFIHDRSNAVEKKYWVKTTPVSESEAEPTLPINPKN